MNWSNTESTTTRTDSESTTGVANGSADILGSGVLMHQSDYPHGEAHFPDTAEIVLGWPIWKDLGREALRQHMAGNAERFLRIS